MPPSSLPTSSLYRACDPDDLPFASTAELPDFDEPVGQERAVEAIRFAIGMRHRGFNLFALGSEGTGRRSLVMQSLGQAAADQPVPDDWIYVNNFAESHKARAIRLPAGRAGRFKRDMDELVDELAMALPAAFDAEEYRTRKQGVEEQLKERQEKVVEDIQRDAALHSVTLMRTPVGLALAPTQDGEVISPDDFKQLPEADQDSRKTVMIGYQERLEAALKQFPQWERETRARIRELDQEVAAFAISHQMDELKERFADLPAVIDFLDAMARDVADNLGDFLEDDEPKPRRRKESRSSGFRRYRVNLLVNNGEGRGAPVVFEDYPTQPNLIGRVEHFAQFGALITDFNLIKPGSLHKANGGYLVMDAHKLLTQPFAWDDLKRSLRARQVAIESPGQSVGLMSTVRLEPEPIPLDIKVVLIGDPMLYYLLSHNDPEFNELFKVSADFDWRMERSQANTLALARSLATLVRKEDLRALDRGAVARIVEQASRDVEDSGQLSTHMASIADLVREADYWARRQDAGLVTAAHVEQAIAASIYRLDRVRERVQQEIGHGTVHIDTEGVVVGQINGLAVLELGRFSFGRPSRITARVRFGRGEVVDIEREVQLGGPIHGKGVLILSSFLSSRFAADQPLSLAASLVFEQSYGGIEGDSASSTELYALLSALADLPLRQNIAVTGSVDQFGRVQAIGGVNEKVEGFFDLCRARGLSGEQGVMIPAANVRHLMLRRDVVEACGKGLFHVWPVETIDQGIELLTGIAAGEADAKGEFPPGTVNRKVAGRLLHFARKAEDMGRPRVPYGNGRNGH
jgi:lon-related putative ATP-dependent protease